MPDTHRIIRRPEEGAGVPEQAGYRRLLARSLSELGIGYGEEYVVVKASEFNAQPTLDDKQLGPFAKDSETSRQAAIDNFPRKGGQKHAILTVFAAQIPKAAEGIEGHVYLGYTRDELEVILKWSGNTIRPRVTELLAGGFLEETKATRPTRAGSPASVLQITEDGRRAIRPETSTHDEINQTKEKP